jgi:hypothetical protein
MREESRARHGKPSADGREGDLSDIHSDEDVEAHKKKFFGTDEPDSDDEDVETHRRRRRGTSPEELAPNEGFLTGAASPPRSGSSVASPVCGALLHRKRKTSEAPPLRATRRDVPAVLSDATIGLC